MATLGGNVPNNLRPDALEHLVATLRIACTTCGHILGDHRHDFTDESRHCVGAEGCACRQFTEAK